MEGLYPKVFVAENVAGLTRGKAKGYFKDILAELKSKGYRVKAKLLDAQWLGVPQSRERLIFIGVREDLTEWVFVSFDGKEYKRVENDERRYWLVRADGVVGEFCWQVVAPALASSLEAEFAGRRSPEAVAEFEINFD